MEKVNAVLTQLASAFDTINAPKSKISKHSLMQDKINKYTKNDSIEISHSSESSSPFKIVRPWNYSDYKYRVMTFSKTANWFAKPSIISPLVCARFGWVNHSADLLYCHVCSKSIRHDGTLFLYPTIL